MKMFGSLISFAKQEHRLHGEEKQNKVGVVGSLQLALSSLKFKMALMPG